MPAPVIRVAVRHSIRRDHDLLVHSVADFAQVPASAVRLDVHCARCGSTRHGKPQVVAPHSAAGAPLQASLSRTTGLEAVAVTDVAPLGLDMEWVDRVARAPIDLHPREQAALQALPADQRHERRTLLWTVKEAVLKATGHGLTVEHASLELAVAAGGAVALVSWPDQLALLEVPQITVLQPAPGLMLAVALLSPTPATVSTTTAAS
ncbi:MAG: 4'-phosphopantetheinyl transferase superfamily protein [Microbacteriaceae bacterium]